MRRRRRRSRAYENPKKTSSGVYWALGAGAVLLGVGAYLLLSPSAAASTSSGGASPALTPGLNVTNVTLHVGQSLTTNPPPVPSATDAQIAAGAQTAWTQTTIEDFEPNGTPLASNASPIFNGNVAARPGSRSLAYVASNKFGPMSGPYFYVNATVVP
jgi:hypothetical protein